MKQNTYTNIKLKNFEEIVPSILALLQKAHEASGQWWELQTAEAVDHFACSYSPLGTQM